MKHSFLKISGKTHYFVFALFLAIALSLGARIDDKINTTNVETVSADTCGDGVIEPSEQCDDNNTSNGDGCDSSCQISTTGYTSQLLAINSDRVDETLTNFPVLLKDANFPSAIYSNTETDGSDLLFTSDAGGSTPLAFEVVNWDTGAEESEVWVKFPSLSSSSNTNFYVWYNNSSAIAPSIDADNGSENVWTNSYAGVWHLEEAATDEQSTATHYDSTSNSNDGTQNGNASVAGFLGNGQAFDGTNDKIDVTSSSSLNTFSEITLSAWVYPTGTAGDEPIIAKEGAGGVQEYLLGINGYKFGCMLGDNWPLNNRDSGGVQDMRDNEWQYLVCRWNGSQAVDFMDGNDVQTTSWGGSIPAGSSTLSFGSNSDVGSTWYVGTIDEVRIANASRTDGWISTTYNNQSNPERFVVRCGDGQVGAGEQCDDGNLTTGDGCSAACQIDTTGYASSYTLNIDNTKVDETVSNFPILLLDGNFPDGIYNNTLSNGSDLVFTSDSGGSNGIPHEVVSWNTTGKTGEVYVKLPTVSSSADTTFYVWYNNASDTSVNESSTEVWDDNFVGVYHLNEDVTDEQTSGTHYDSTAWDNDGVQNNNVENTGGKIGTAQDFDETADYIDLGTPGSLRPSPNMTLEGWAKFDKVAPEWDILVASQDDNAIAGYSLMRRGNNSAGVHAQFGSGGTYRGCDGATQITDGVWNYYAGTYDGTTSKCYLNDSLDGSYSSSGIIAHTYPTRIGMQPGGGGPRYADGLIDEIRISDTDRSAGWISTTYNNQSNPSTFIYSCGDGTIQSGEQCDDGNIANGDGCDSSCNMSITGYNSVQLITIDNTKVDENLSNFPILLADDNFRENVYDNTQSNGEDLLFSTDSNGSTIIPHEVVNWDTAGDTSEVWAKLPSISSSADTTFYVWYNNSSAIAPSADADNGSENVWDSNYLAVWHLNEAATDEQTSATHYDSTVNSYDGAQSGNATVSDEKIGNSQVFDGTDDRIESLLVLDQSGGTDYTIEAWAYPLGTSSGRHHVVGTDSGGYDWSLLREGGTWYVFTGADSVSTGHSVTTNTWQHLASVYIPGTGTRAYKNGSEFTTASIDTDANSHFVNIGRNTGVGEYIDARIDEVRVSDTVRSAGWISTSYNNQNSPSTFASGSVIGTELPTTTNIDNVSPLITVTPSDGGSASSSQTLEGTDVTFTTTANDINGHQFYLAVCKTDAVTAGNDAAPTCDGGEWAISTATDSDSEASVSYTTQAADSGTNDWYAFVCDKLIGGGVCHPANGSGNQGRAGGMVNFTGIPVDGATLTIDSVTYEFDTADDGVSGGTEIDSASSQGVADVADALVTAETGANTSMVSRAATVYIYADTHGVAGNSITLAKVGDTGDLITLSGANLAGGSDDNASPFVVNQIPTFGTVTVTDDSDGTIEPGDTLKFTLPSAEIDDDGTVIMHICTEATTAFDYGTDTCTDGATVCSSSAVDPDTTDATCTGGASLVTAPTAHGNYNFKVYQEDDQGVAGTGTNTQSYTVEDVAPVFVSYTATDEPSNAAGGSDTVDFSVSLTDGNGDNDVTAVEGVFFDDDAVNNDCAADENDCYIAATCTLTDQSTPGTGKTATGTDTALGADCSVTVWFNANASSNWEVQAKPTDGLGQETGFEDSNANLTNPALLGIGITQSSIAYGILELGKTSTRFDTSMGNFGNQTMDVFISGTDMCTDFPTCSGDTIPAAQQKWYHQDTDFNWAATPANPGPYTLVTTASGTDDETGCLNRDIGVRNAHAVDSTNESIYWKMQIPFDQALGSYTGENSFSAASSGTCSSAQSY